MPSTTKIPASAKRPQDYREKAPAAQVADAEGGKLVTYQGVEVFVADDALDDFELLDDLCQVQNAQDATRMPSMLRRTIGEDGYRKAMNALRDPDTGRVSVEAATTYLGVIFEALAPNS